MNCGQPKNPDFFAKQAFFSEKSNFALGSPWSFVKKVRCLAGEPPGKGSPAFTQELPGH